MQRKLFTWNRAEIEVNWWLRNCDTMWMAIMEIQTHARTRTHIYINVYTRTYTHSNTRTTLVNSFSNAADCRRYVAGSSLIRQHRDATQVRAQCWLTAAATCRVNRALTTPSPPLSLSPHLWHHMPHACWIFSLINFNLRHLPKS